MDLLMIRHFLMLSLDWIIRHPRKDSPLALILATLETKDEIDLELEG